VTTPHITRVQPIRPRGLKVRIHLDGGEPFEITLEALERSRLGCGDDLPPDRQHQLINDDQDIRVRDAAFNLISYSARTRAELKRRLRQKGFRPARIDVCLDRLEEMGFVDDKAVAAAFVRDRLLHRPRGKAALSSELRTIDQVFETQETSDTDLAREMATKWIARQNAGALEALASDSGSPAKAKARRRLMGYLSRRGFRGEAMGEGMTVAVQIARERGAETF
jgi:regulatory protein